MTKLPAGGRTGAPPPWPLGGDVQLETSIEFAKLEVKNQEHEAEWASNARERSSARRKIERGRKKVAELQAMKKAAGAVEKQIWAALWKTPQATQWEKRGWYREVALYARHQAKAEAGSLDDSKEARQREDRLGLNDMSMLRLRWEIGDAAGAGAAPKRRSKRGSGAYGDLRVV